MIEVDTTSDVLSKPRIRIKKIPSSQQLVDTFFQIVDDTESPINEDITTSTRLKPVIKKSGNKVGLRKIKIIPLSQTKLVENHEPDPVKDPNWGKPPKPKAPPTIKSVTGNIRKFKSSNETNLPNIPPWEHEDKVTKPIEIKLGKVRNNTLHELSDIERADRIIKVIKRNEKIAKLWDKWMEQHPLDVEKRFEKLKILQQVREKSVAIRPGRKPDREEVLSIVDDYLHERLELPAVKNTTLSNHNKKVPPITPLETIIEFRDNILKPSPGNRIGSQELYNRYRLWCNDRYGSSCGATSVKVWGGMIKDNAGLFKITKPKGCNFIHNYI